MWPKYRYTKTWKTFKNVLFFYEVFFTKIVYVFLLKGMYHLFEFSTRETGRRFSPEMGYTNSCFVLGHTVCQNGFE